MFTDARLGDAWSHLDSGGADVLVVDVFETLLWRLAPRPAHLFLLLGERLAAAGRLPAGITPGQFAHLRILAERQARRRVLATREGVAAAGDGGGPAPRLDEIWALLRPALPGAGELAPLVEAEVAALRAAYRVDLAAAELVELAALKLGLPVYLVADTCLSAAQLERLLTRPELAGIPFAGPFTSADIGVGTAEGLLGHVLTATGAPTSRLLYLAGDPTGEHTGAAGSEPAGGPPGRGTGDGRAAGQPAGGSGGSGGRDGRGGHAGRGGRGVTIVRRGGPARDLRATLAMEGLLDEPDDAAPVDLEYGDFGLTALRARVLHRADAAAVPRALRRFWDTGATVFGPVFTGFAEWVVERTRELGADEAFCLMRSGRFVASLLESPGRDAGVAARTLWASREVCALANVFEASPEELRAFLRHAGTGPAHAGPGGPAPGTGGAVGTVGALLRRLRVDLAAAPGISALAGRRLDVPAGLLDEILDELLETLSRDDRVRGEIVLAAERLRERFLRYLDDRLPERGPAVMVDLGWDGTTQALLARLLTATGREVIPVGLYLATGPAALEYQLAGHRMEGYLVSGGQPARLAGQLLRAPAVVEQVAMADTGRLASFDEMSTPLLGLARTSRTQLAQRAAAQDGARAFQQEWLRYRRAESPDSPDSALPSLGGDSARLALLRMLARFVARPTTAEAATFGSWRHDGDDDEPVGIEATSALVVDGRPPGAASEDGSFAGMAGAAGPTGPTGMALAGAEAGGVASGQERPAAGLGRAGSESSATVGVPGAMGAGPVTGRHGRAEPAEQDGRGLLPAELIRRMPYLSPAGLAELPLREATWPAAVAAVANRPLAVVTELAAAAGIDPRELSAPAAAGPVEVYVDTGADFARGPKAIAVPYAGRDGLSLVRLRVVDAVGVRRVRVDPAGRRGLLRLDWLTLAFHIVGAGEPRQITITAFDGPGSLPDAMGRSIPAGTPGETGLVDRRRGIVLGLVGLRILQPNLVEILDDDPQLVYNLDLSGMPELGGTYAIDVEFAFGWIGIRGDPVAAPAPAAAGPASGPQLPRRAARRVMRQLGGLR
ncbi:haloacid dehalogenase [Pseudofrankia sp. BMG5.36]|uniref:haloacid dehalogenase n=1 Tax=Pseudofrankia sp. BMG5.36 TaxID=1834512 RepID=UPI0009F32D75|nr:haloacid dehalogenase [Pseudofrankia sp. BMG5.36]